MKRQGSILAFFLSLFPLQAQDRGPGESPASRLPSGTLPLISRLDNRDLGFIQYQEDVENARRRIFRSSGLSEEELAGILTVYRYVPGEGEDLFSIAARCSIPYAGLATINRLSHPVLPPAGELLLPSMPGIFVPSEPDSGIELLLAASRASRGGVDIRLNPDGTPGGGRGFRFFPGDDYSPTERIFFLNRGFRFPLRSFTITSTFGPRVNPVTGRFRVHEGLDLAAPEGTDVLAAEAGQVTETGSDPIYGNYIVIKHRDDWASLYGHLSRIDVVLHQELRSGSLIGKVGSTGQSTGPHLHFELRKNGRAQDPGKYLFD
ncbi:MAG: M23 family metallopeptidase [Treponema sp.]|nr:M23 family metallopeptidase [Treponema sp.]